MSVLFGGKYEIRICHELWHSKNLSITIIAIIKIMIVVVITSTTILEVHVYLVTKSNVTIVNSVNYKPFFT